MNDKKRLMDIINIIDPNKNVIDIGTDHGLVPLYLGKNKISTNILATDISEASLNKLRLELDDELRKVIKTKVTDGFDGIEMLANQIAIIAGMGANTIIDIISKNINFAKNLDYMILESNIGTEKLRLYLIEHDFVIVRDFLTYEKGKYYDILKVKKGKSKQLDLSSIYYGHENIENKNILLKQKLKEENEKNQKFKENILLYSKDRTGLDRVLERLSAIDEVYNKWK